MCLKRRREEQQGEPRKGEKKGGATGEEGKDELLDGGGDFAARAEDGNADGLHVCLCHRQQRREVDFLP